MNLRLAMASLVPSSPPARQAAVLVQRRWRRHPKGGIHGPQFHRFPTEVKMNWPPKDRSKLFLLPDSKRLLCVAKGWYYPDGITGRDKKETSVVLSFASKNKHNHMDSLTVQEVQKLWELAPDIQAQFKECEAKLEEDNDPRGGA
ncbi:unnamed protein product [Effrenium voratum]|uniref:Uncharacterized protein n=1 Tax=Effrenium voratum TaxID=2562239 RepID=A0AA36N557_9DINO|nr:unnamed protein product [Effrenium voratum]CAJ1389872.1 unnamed protein product [Effrenium voratum]